MHEVGFKKESCIFVCVYKTFRLNARARRSLKYYITSSFTRDYKEEILPYSLIAIYTYHIYSYVYNQSTTQSHCAGGHLVGQGRNCLDVSCSQ